MKLLFWLLLVFIIVGWLSRARKNGGHQPQMYKQPADGAEKMLKCRYCGLHVPASEALLHSSGDVFCSEEHKRLIFP